MLGVWGLLWTNRTYVLHCTQSHTEVFVRQLAVVTNINISLNASLSRLLYWLLQCQTINNKSNNFDGGRELIGFKCIKKNNNNSNNKKHSNTWDDPIKQEHVGIKKCLLQINLYLLTVSIIFVSQRDIHFSKTKST